MRYLLFMGALAWTACTPDANNITAPAAQPIDQPQKTESGSASGSTAPDSTVPDSDAELQACSNSSPANSAHPLLVTRDTNSGAYQIKFAQGSDAALRVISLYVTAMKDEVPTFENKFKFDGTAYWMVSLDDPFETYFNLPVSYGALPPPALDVSERYKGKPGGVLLSELNRAQCIKFTVITFEPEEEQSFKTSTFLQVHRP